jgi:hypothetical protein
MDPFQELVRIAREQSAALARGELETAVRLLDDRAVILQSLGQARTVADENAVREVMRRDRDLSSAIRERMIDIRNRSLKLQHGRAALSGYGAGPARQLGLIDATR